MRPLLRSLLALLLPAALSAQGVVVSPPTLVVDHRLRSGALELFNPSERAIEVRVELLFGYPVTDASGQFGLETPAVPPAGMRAATSWVEAFPSRLVIQGSGRQTVRFLARPPATLEDGEYFTRVVVTSKFATPTGANADAANIQTELSVEVRAVTTLLYRKGAVAPTIALSAPSVTQSGDTLGIRVMMTPGGSAAFLGTIAYSLEDASGRVVATHAQPVSIYVPVTPLVRLPVAGVAPGQYRLRVRALSERADLPSGVILPTTATELAIPTSVAPR